MPIATRILIFTLICACTCHAQVAATLQLNKKQYVAGEAVVATITITNHAGRELVFHGDGRRDWLEFNIRDRRGNPVNARMRQAFGAMRIAAGQSLSREVDLSKHYMLHEQGNYSASAVVRSLTNDSISTTTNRLIFTLNNGRIYWSQKVGLPKRRDQTREYRVLQFSGNQKTQLYCQIMEDRTGLPIRTFNLGDTLSIRKPSATVDQGQRLHVLFLATPVMWVHYVIDIDGNVVDRKIHQRGAQGDPRLLTFADGSVQVANSIPFDPEAAAAARAKIRRVSERPAVVYE